MITGAEASSTMTAISSRRRAVAARSSSPRIARTIWPGILRLSKPTRARSWRIGESPIRRDEVGPARGPPSRRYVERADPAERDAHGHAGLTGSEYLPRRCGAEQSRTQILNVRIAPGLG